MAVYGRKILRESAGKEVDIMEILNYPMEEVMQVVSELAGKYTGCDHSSVTYEKAQMLMGAVMYCVREYEQQKSNALLTKNVSVKEAYRYGREIVLDKRKKLQELYNELILDFRDYGSVCMHYTIRQGIPAFLERYDDRYAPQETLLTLDYPILVDYGALSGVSRVLNYVQCICLEQKFLQKMDEGYVIKILRAYQRDYAYMIENICEVVCQNLLGHMMLDKPLQEIGFDKEELGSLEDILAEKTKEQISAFAFKAMEQLTGKYYDDNDLLLYLNSSLPDIVTRIQCSLQNHCLGNLFVI